MLRSITCVPKACITNTYKTHISCDSYPYKIAFLFKSPFISMFSYKILDVLVKYSPNDKISVTCQLDGLLLSKEIFCFFQAN